MRTERKSKHDEIKARGNRGDDAESQASSRDNVVRGKIHNKYENRFSLAGIKIPDGMVYQWIRISVTGYEDTENQEKAYHDGWTPVPKDRHPELSIKTYTLRNQESNFGNVIVRGGQILMERTKEEDDDEKMELHQLNMTNINSLPALTKNNQHGGIYVRDNKTSAGSFKGETGADARRNTASFAD